MNEAEFYPNATLGFRQWYLTLENGEDEPPSLEGFTKYDLSRPRYHWDAGGVNHAECMRLKFHPGSLSEAHGEIPAVGCSCGFYAHSRRDSSNTETTTHIVGGVVAGWGNVELHEMGFRCSVAKIMAFFEPDSRKSYADYDGVSLRKWAALIKICEHKAIPILGPDSLKDEEEVRQYAYERDLALVEEQLGVTRL